MQHRNIAFWGMAMIAFGLPVSVFLVSVGTFVLAGNWLLEGQFQKRLKQFFSDPLSLILISIFLIHLVGMAWTENFQMGLKDLRIKLPILLMPLLLFTTKLPDKQRQYQLLLLFVVGCIIGSLFGMLRYFQLGDNEVLNHRNLSVFISHIRFGLMLTLAFFILAYFLFSKWSEWSVAEKMICAASMIWILGFMILLEAFTAYFAFAAVLLFSSIRLLSKQSGRLLKMGIWGTIFLLMIACSAYFQFVSDNHFQEIPFDYRTLTVKTANGNYYAHQKDVLYRENGHRVWNFVCLEELKQEWPTRSSVDFEGNDKKGQPIKFTAIRYLTSKGLMKDSVGIHQLNSEDIALIEQGYTNCRYADGIGIAERVDQLLWAFEEYSWHQNANNSSTLQRWVYLEVGWSIFKEHVLFGVGTGDVINAYRESYSIDDHGLEVQFQGISHNQFLTIAIALGVVGFGFFLFALIYPLYLYRHDYLYVAFFILVIVSFLTDNTFDRQSGVTLFAFFNSFLILRREFAETN